MDANVTVTGRDDSSAQQGSGEFTLTIPAGGAQTVKSSDLEAGNAESDGIGDGRGKWSLDIQSDVPIEVVNLMSTVSGHLTNLSGTNPDYREPVGMWQVSFEDGEGGDGFVVLLPDSRMYAWLPEANDIDRVARATFRTTAEGVSGAGDLYESGRADPDGFDVKGVRDDFEFTAEYRSGDWIRGQYTREGQSSRSFRGWAFTGFARGGRDRGGGGIVDPGRGRCGLVRKLRTGRRRRGQLLLPRRGGHLLRQRGIRNDQSRIRRLRSRRNHHLLPSDTPPECRRPDPGGSGHRGRSRKREPDPSCWRSSTTTARSASDRCSRWNANRRCLFPDDERFADSRRFDLDLAVGEGHPLLAGVQFGLVGEMGRVGVAGLG